MHVFQTAGVPPSRGSTILANIGWTRNSSVALTSSVRAKKNCIRTPLAVPGSHQPGGMPSGTPDPAGVRRTPDKSGL